MRGKPTFLFPYLILAYAQITKPLLSSFILSIFGFEYTLHFYSF